MVSAHVKDALQTALTISCMQTKSYVQTLILSSFGLYSYTEHGVEVISFYIKAIFW